MVRSTILDGTFDEACVRSYFSDIQPVNKEVEAGTDTTISCLITGISRHVETVTWKKDGTDVSSLSESNYIVSVGAYESDSQNTTLTVSGAANTADSMYTCAITSNEWSQVDQEATVVLNVFGRLFPSFRFSFTKVKNTACHISLSLEYCSRNIT